MDTTTKPLLERTELKPAANWPQTFDEATAVIHKLLVNIRALHERIEELEDEAVDLEMERDEYIGCSDAMEQVRECILKGDTEYAIELIGRQIGY